MRAHAFMRTMKLAVLTISVVVASVAAGPQDSEADQAASDPSIVFRAGADLVNVGVSVLQNGQPVRGLSSSTFEILDDGVRQQIIDFSFDQWPIDVTVALDVSHSVTGPLLDRLRQAIDDLRLGLRAEDRLKVMTFNMRVERVLDFQEPRPYGIAAIGPSGGFGSTAVLDTVAVALTTATPTERRHLVIVFSDGLDTMSVTEPAMLVDVARRTSATLAFVLPRTRRPVGPAPPDPAIYERFAAETGGSVIRVLSTGDLGALFRQVLDEFRASYLLRFVPRGVSRQGYHTLDVRVRQPGLDVRARRGYVWR